MEYYFNMPTVQDYIVLDMCQLRSNSLLMYQYFDGPRGKKHDLSQYDTYTGTVTTHSKKRLKRVIDILVQISDPEWILNTVTNKTQWFKMAFITTTISSKERLVSIPEGNKKLMKPFLRRLKKLVNINSYVWKAEFQKNGQLHYHITTNTFIPWQIIRDEWNIILYKNGLLTSYLKTHKSTNANSTDVHSTYKIRDMSAYLAKYFSKAEQNYKGKGKVWSCSDNLRRANYFTFLPENGQVFPDNNPKVKTSDYYAMWYRKNPLNFLNDAQKVDYEEWKRQVRENDFKDN